ncbi:uncharacterized protein LOC119646898 [Hermetia illucens]|uniref:uncharacterized protein LOC119646898 n=1 Tax=Hermetia illucens TaxID=343691 RepID=UPI0018CC536E|nr:uncharacterized protein LOC119646898 [Hermetia illucens]
MYYDLVWNEVLIGNFRNAFLATFASFYVFVLMDFIILFMANHILSIKKQKFMDYLDDQLQSSEWNHGVLRLIKEIKTTLKKTPKFKIFFVLDIDWATFLLGGAEFLMTIGFVVIYQYINQKFKIAKFEA